MKCENKLCIYQDNNKCTNKNKIEIDEGIGFDVPEEYKELMEQYKEETFDPLSCYPPAERKQIEEHLKRQEEIMKQFYDALDKHEEQ